MKQDITADALPFFERDPVPVERVSVDELPLRYRILAHFRRLTVGSSLFGVYTGDRIHVTSDIDPYVAEEIVQHEIGHHNAGHDDLKIHDIIFMAGTGAAMLTGLMTTGMQGLGVLAATFLISSIWYNWVTEREANDHAHAGGVDEYMEQVYEDAIVYGRTEQASVLGFIQNTPVRMAAAIFVAIGEMVVTNTIRLYEYTTWPIRSVGRWFR